MGMPEILMRAKQGRLVREVRREIEYLKRTIEFRLSSRVKEKAYRQGDEA